MKLGLGALLSSLVAVAVGCATAGGASSTATDGGLVEAGGPDATVDGSGDEDAGPIADGSADATDAGKLACPPGPVTAFTPKWKPPKPLHSGVCTAAQAAFVVDCAFDPSANQSACDAFLADAGTSSCTLCVLTDDFDTSYGPLVMHGAYAVLNLGGCIAQQAGDTSATGCGAKVQAISECQEFACTGCPDPGINAQALSDYLKCQSAAMSTVCSSYVSAGSCADPLIQPDGSAADCASGSNNFLDRARHLARIFCGP